MHAWNIHLSDFVTHGHAAGLSPGTIRQYDYKLVDLARVVPRGPEHVTHDHIVTMLANPRWAAQTKKCTRSAFRTFFGWGVATGRWAHDPTVMLPAIRVPQPLPRPTPEPILGDAIRAASPREDFMIRLGAYAGLRACEIARVHSSDWDVSRKALTVHGKGGKTRRVPVREPRTVELLDLLEGWAFPNRWTGAPITPGHVTKLLSSALRETWTGHTLRHRYATVGLRGTKNLLAVSRALGHSRLDTTQVYTLLDDDELVAVAEAAAA